MLIDSQIDNIKTHIEYSELFVSEYTIKWLDIFGRICQQKLHNIFEKLANATADSGQIYNELSLLITIPKYPEKVKQYLNSEDFRYNLYELLNLFKLFINQLVDLDIQTEYDSNNYKNKVEELIFDIDPACPEMDDKVHYTLYGIYQILAQLFYLSLYNKEYKKDIENILLEFFKIYKEKFFKFINKNNIQNISAYKLSFLMIFCQDFSAKQLTTNTKSAVLVNAISNGTLNKILKYYFDLFLINDFFKDSFSSRFILSKNQLIKYKDKLNLSCIGYSLGVFKLKKNIYNDKDTKINLSALIYTPIDKDFYDQYLKDCIPYYQYLYPKCLLTNFNFILLPFFLKNKNLKSYSRLSIYDSYVNGEFILNEINQKNFQNFCVNLFKNFNITNKDERKKFWSDFINAIYFNKNSKNLVNIFNKQTLFNWSNFFKRRFIGKHIEEIIQYHIDSIKSKDLNELAKNYIYSENFFKNNIFKLNLNTYLDSVYSIKVNPNIINTYLNEIKKKVENK